MITLVILIVFPLLILAFGFLGIKIPFFTATKDVTNKKAASLKPHINHKENLVKNPVDYSLLKSRLFKEKRTGVFI